MTAPLNDCNPINCEPPDCEPIDCEPINCKPVAMPPYLDTVKVVMVNTSLPANIGSAARAMWTMGFSQLLVVKPKLPIDVSSIAHAAGAQTVLNKVKIVATLAEAIADCALVFAASSRQRHIPRPVVNPSQAAQLIIDYQRRHHNAPSRPKIAVLFGREDRGLTNDELAMADYHIQIDANPAYPVLNVAAAVQVITSFFYSEFLHAAQYLANSNTDDTLAIQQPMQDPMLQLMLRQVWDAPAITQQQKISLQTRITALMHTLTLTDSTNPDDLGDLPKRLSRLMSRLQLDQKEYELINTLVAKIHLKL